MKLSIELVPQTSWYNNLRKGWLQMRDLRRERNIAHFMKVNGCGRKAFESHKESAFREWKRRSSREWKVAVGEYERMASGKENGGSLERFL